MQALLLFLTLLAAGSTGSVPTQNASTPAPVWADFQKILDTGIHKNSFSGKYGNFTHNAFDYKKLINHKDFKGMISSQKEILEKATAPNDRFEKLAFWINAYNFFTVVDVTSEFPVKSMTDIGWKKAHHVVGGKKYSLDEIEHKILRPMGEPKIHFAINCASVSCPSLNDKIFKADTVGQELKMLTENAFKNPLHIRPDGGDVEVTQLMDWFGGDFKVAPFKSKEGFLKRYAPEALQRDVDGYITYDWDLNSPENIASAMKKLGLTKK